MHIRRALGAAALLAGSVMFVPAAVPASAAPTPILVFNGEDNRLNAYDGETGDKQTVIPSAADDPENGLDINAQICFFPDGSRRFIAGEDTGQGRTGQPGWGIFQLHGNQIGNLSADLVGKLSPTFQTSDNADENDPWESNPENYGCGFLSDGRVLTSDVGNQFPGTPNNGQLIIWFPHPEHGFNTFDVEYCKLDIHIPTAGGVYVDDQDRIYVTANRPGQIGDMPGGLPDPNWPAGVYRYSGPFPTSGTPEGGCDATDDTGAPMASEVNRELFILGNNPVELLTPSAIIRSPAGGFYVSSVFDGRIGEYDAEGEFIRHILMPPPGLPPYETGTPFGIGVDSQGTLYYADMGVEVGPPPGPGDEGKVRRIRFVDGEPQAPEVIDDGLAFPDGIGVLDQGRPGGRPDNVPPNPPGRQQTVGGQARADGLPATGGGFPLAAGLGALAGGLGLRLRRRP